MKEFEQEHTEGNENEEEFAQVNSSINSLKTQVIQQQTLINKLMEKYFFFFFFLPILSNNKLIN